MFNCPLCNGLINIEGKCPYCGSSLEERGRVADFLGPYSAYEDTGFKLEDKGCLHLIACKKCGWDQRLLCFHKFSDN